MIKTTYQTPELRNANDEVVQEGAFGKNTALSNSTNDGWIDYVMNDLEALHDTIGDSAPTLDGNGHVVEPANLAIGDEDGLRIKNNYLKLSGGKVTGIASFRSDLRMLDNQDNRFGGLYVPGTTATEQYMQLYGGTRATGDARLTLYPSGDGHFQLLAYSSDGSNSYALQSDNAGNLNWRGYPLAWKKDYLPLAGGTMTGAITLQNGKGYLRSYSNGTYLYGDTGNSISSVVLYTNEDGSGFRLIAGNGTTSTPLVGRPDGILTWGGKNIERIESKGTNYIRYVSGLQIVFDAVGNVTEAGTYNYTFPVPFKSYSDVKFGLTKYWGYNTSETCYVRDLTGTGFSLVVQGTVSSNNHGYHFVASGWWK